jgi:DNA-binding NarL/FixJ family response regulator
MCKILFINKGIIVQTGLRQILEENLPIDHFHMVSDITEWTKHGQYNLIIIGSIKTDIGELVKKIKAHDSQTRVLVFSDMKYADAMHAVIAGADGFVDQLAEIEEIVRAVTDLMIGKRYWGKQLVKDMAMQILQAGNQGKTYSPLTISHLLSKRQTEVLRALIQGESIPTIAIHFGLSPSTILTHKSNAFKKLGISDIGQLMEACQSATNYLNQQAENVYLSQGELP